MAVLSIQSHVVYGHAGNSSAVFPLQRLGHEVWAVNTVEFSNHTGYGAWKGTVLGADLVQDLVQGLEDRGVLKNCRAVLSGYMGDASTGKAILRALDMVKAASPKALYCCDPVMGDLERGFYVKPGIPEIFRSEIIPRADIVTPNQFELEALTGMDSGAMEGAARAVARLHSMGPRTVLVTSFRCREEQARKGQAEIAMLASSGKDLWLVRTPEIPIGRSFAGAGDLTTAVFLARLLGRPTGFEEAGEASPPEHFDIKEALEKCAASVYGIIEETWKAKADELLIIAAQDQLSNPAFMFSAEKL
ncbi:MAG: pyridoxal kinase PdxY [Treponema sp.]|jgi:pyridoxine kinase|nr:pyridoxal kinase PdxY [Treponema sp.]